MGKYAILIGVDTYKEGLQSLPAAPKDVAAMREVLLNPKMGGFDEAKPLINPTHPEMAREIELWFLDRQPEDLVLLFFSGHGLKDDRRDLYLASASTEKIRNRLVCSTAISARFIHDCIRSCRAKYQVLILDCCFSGAFGEFVARDDGDVNLTEQLGAEGRAVLTSTSSVDYSFEAKGADLSVYTHYLVEGIASGAADADGDGVITIDELHRYAGSKVKEASPAMSPTLITLKDEGFRIRIARSPQDDPKLKYRKEVDQRATSGQFSIPAKQLLISLRRDLDISDEEAENIEAEVLKPYQEYQSKRKEYQDTLQKCFRNEAMLEQNLVKDLIDLRKHLRLKSEDIESIEKENLSGLTLEEHIVKVKQDSQKEAIEKRKSKIEHHQQIVQERQLAVSKVSLRGANPSPSRQFPKTSQKATSASSSPLRIQKNTRSVPSRFNKNSSSSEKSIRRVLHLLGLTARYFTTDIGFLIFPITYIFFFQSIGFPPLGIFVVLLVALLVWRTVITLKKRYKERGIFKSILFGIGRFLYSILILFFSMLFVKFFIQQMFFIVGNGFLLGMKADERVLVDRTRYRFHDPRIGDIVVFSDSEQEHVSRIFGQSGETVKVRQGELFVDDQLLKVPFDPDMSPFNLEKFDRETSPFYWVQDTEIKIPMESSLIFMSNGSFEIVENTKIIGRADTVFWPLSRRRKIHYKKQEWLLQE